MNNSYNQNNNYNQPEMNSYAYNNMNNQNNIGNNYSVQKRKWGNTSLILGIISLVLTPLISILAVPVQIVGMVLGSKAKEHGKTGLTLNIIALVINVIIFSIAIFWVGLFESYNTILEENKSNKPSYFGDYTCDSYSQDIESIEDLKENLLISLNKDGTYTFSSGKDSEGDLMIKGNYTLDYEDYKEQLHDQKYAFTFDATYRKINGVEYDEPYKTKFEFSFDKDSDEAALVINTVSYSMYICRKIK